MKKLLGNLVKAAVVGALIGVALSYALPALATMAGYNVAATVGFMAEAKWMSLFVGAFSVASVAANALVDSVIKKAPAAPAGSAAITEKAAVEMCHTPELGGGIFCQRIEAERSQSANNIGLNP